MTIEILITREDLATLLAESRQRVRALEAALYAIARETFDPSHAHSGRASSDDCSLCLIYRRAIAAAESAASPHPASAVPTEPVAADAAGGGEAPLLDDTDDGA